MHRDAAGVAPHARQSLEHCVRGQEAIARRMRRVDILKEHLPQTPDPRPQTERSERIRGRGCEDMANGEKGFASDA